MVWQTLGYRFDTRRDREELLDLAGPGLDLSAIEKYSFRIKYDRYLHNI